MLRSIGIPDHKTRPGLRLLGIVLGINLSGGKLTLPNILKRLARPERFELPTTWFAAGTSNQCKRLSTHNNYL